MNTEILKSKRTEVMEKRQLITTTAEETALAALIKMKRNGIHHLPVLRDGRLDGIVSDRNILARALEIGMADQLSWLNVRDAMQKNVSSVSRDTEIGEALQIMLEEGASALPVVEDGELRGIVTETDILRCAAENIREGDSLVPGAQYLANPFAQKLMSLLAALGI